MITVRAAGGGDSPERSEIVDVEAGRPRGGDRALGRRPSGDSEAGIRSDSAEADALGAVLDADGEVGVLGDLADCSSPEAEVHEAALDADGEEGVLGDLADCSSPEAESSPDESTLLLLGSAGAATNAMDSAVPIAAGDPR